MRIKCIDTEVTFGQKLRKVKHCSQGHINELGEQQCQTCGTTKFVSIDYVGGHL